MTQTEMRQIQERAGRAAYLARRRDQRRISEAEYIDLLNALRRKQGLWPLRTPELQRAVGWKEMRHDDAVCE